MVQVTKGRQNKNKQILIQNSRLSGLGFTDEGKKNKLRKNKQILDSQGFCIKRTLGLTFSSFSIKKNGCSSHSSEDDDDDDGDDNNMATMFLRLCNDKTK